MADNRMGIDAAGDTLHECDGCEATVLATKADLANVWKWRVHSGAGWRLVLCDECQARSTAEAAS